MEQAAVRLAGPPISYGCSICARCITQNGSGFVDLFLAFVHQTLLSPTMSWICLQVRVNERATFCIWTPLHHAVMTNPY